MWPRPLSPSYAAGPQPSNSAEARPSPAALLDNGFHSLYELNFKGAREDFVSYQEKNPTDAMGSAAEAASYLYEEFNAKGIFTSQFFLNDDKFLHGADGTAAENRNSPFLSANNRARAMAKATLKTEPNNAHALLVLTMADGMESDYDAMIVKKQMAGLGLMRQAEAEANKLLAIDPDAKDGYLALGASNYVIGNLSGFKRAFLWFGGIHGDKDRGIQQMQLAADHGHYLKPFAKDHAGAGLRTRTPHGSCPPAACQPGGRISLESPLRARALADRPSGRAVTHFTRAQLAEVHPLPFHANAIIQRRRAVFLHRNLKTESSKHPASSICNSS